MIIAAFATSTDQQFWRLILRFDQHTPLVRSVMSQRTLYPTCRLILTLLWWPSQRLRHTVRMKSSSSCWMRGSSSMLAPRTACTLAPSSG